MTSIVAVVGPLPPPTTGRAVVTEAFVDSLRRRIPATTYDVGLGTPSRARQARKLLRYLRAGCATALGRRRRLVLVTSDGPWLLFDLLILALARVRRAAVLLHHHNWTTVDDDSRLMRWLVSAAPPGSVHLVLCEAMAERLRSRHGPLESRVLSNAAFVDGHEVGKQRRPSDAPVVLGMLGNLTAEKGVPEALGVLRGLQDERIDARLLLAGPCTPEVEALLVEADRGNRTSIERLGYVDGAARDQFLARCDVLLFPSRYRNEAQPMAVLEALAAGVPVLAVQRSCLTDDLDGLGWTAETPDTFVPFAVGWARDTGPEEWEDLRGRARERFELLQRSARTELDGIVEWIMTREATT